MDVTALTHHGGRVDRAIAAYPDAPAPWLDLSTGINPVPWAPANPLAIDLGRLPTSDELAALEAAAAAAFGVDPAWVAAVPGTEVALRLLGRIGLPRPHRYLAPGYRTHAAVFDDAAAVTEPTGPVDAGTLLLANPVNPTGQLRAADAVRGLAGAGWLIVDEAFVDCTPGASIVPDLPPRTIVLRSFGKFFGLAGLRLGFVIAPADVLATLRRLLGDWPVSAPALAYGTAAYRDADWIAATQVRLREQAAALDAVLLRHGLIARGACPLFRLVETNSPIFDRLARGGILTRPFDYAPRWLRLGLPADAAALARLDAALADG